MLLSLLMIFQSLISVSPAQADDPVSLACGVTVAFRFQKEIKSVPAVDDYYHCSASCVIAHYCGPLASAEVGVLKEIYDLMGFGDPEWSDLLADKEGLKLGTQFWKIKSRKQCYQACAKIFPTP